MATTSTSEASDTENSTTSEMPAPVSSSSTSKRGIRVRTTCKNSSRTSGVRREYSTMPEPASSTEKPPGALTIASSRVALPVNTSCSVTLGCRFSTTSRLARPRSASSTRTRWPLLARAAARLADTKVLPTPPLPLVIAITLAPEPLRGEGEFRMLFITAYLCPVLPWRAPDDISIQAGSAADK